MKSKFNYLASILFAILVPTMANAQDTWDGTFAESFASGDGTEANPYIITSAEEWAYFCEQSKTDDFTDKYIKLATDLYFPTTLSYAPSVRTFNGVFDGDGYTIEFNKYYNSNSPAQNNGGMFFSLKGTIKNLSFVNVLPSQGKYGKEWFVKLVSRIERTGVVTNCYLRNGGNGGDGYTALVAMDNNGLIDNCYGLLNAPAVKVGEVFNNYGSITNCHTQVNGQRYTNNFSWSIYNNPGKIENCDNIIISLDEWKAQIKEIPSTCKIKFYNSSITPIIVERGSELRLPIPEDYRYTFVQWYYKDEPLQESIIVNYDMGLTAFWKREIKSQPSTEIPEFIVQDQFNAEYQWYQVDENEVYYPSWQSINKEDNSVSSYNYTIQANQGQQITFKWNVSSDVYDCLKIAINGNIIMVESGKKSGYKIFDVPMTDTYTITVSYTKDDDDSDGEDMAQIEYVKLSYPDVALVDANTNELPLEYRQRNKKYYCKATYTEYTDAKENIISPNVYTSDTIIYINTIIASGKSDYYLDNTRWYLTDEGLLRIFGSGKIPSYISYSYFPWFKYSNEIKNIEIDEGITYIPEYAFWKNTNLENVKIASTVTSIGNNAFYGCNNLKSIICLSDTPPSIANNNTFYDVSKMIPVYVPNGSVSVYENSNVWNTFTNIKSNIIYEKGDINGDGKIDISDITILINIILEKEEDTNGTADINNDGYINLSDIHALCDIILGK